MIDSKKVLAITLARGGSKSVLKKNIRPVGGQPLLCYTTQEAFRAKRLTAYIDDFIVSTDDPEIQALAISEGALCPFLRPADLSSDTATSAHALQHAVRFLEEAHGCTYDYIIELMCTNPGKRAEDINACIEKLHETGADSVIAVDRLYDHHPRRIKMIVDDHIVDFMPEIPETRRQDLSPAAYIRCGAIYALTRSLIMEKGLRYGTKNSRPYIMPHGHSINIDEESDFIKAEIILSREGVCLASS